MKNLIKVFSVLAMLGAVNVAQANSVSLTPSAQIGNSISFDLNVNFSDTATSLGTFDLTYDSSLLTLTSFTYGTFFNNPPTMVSLEVVTTTPGLISGIGFVGSFGVSRTLATAIFSVKGTGTAILDTVETDGFYTDVTSSSLIQGVGYSGASAQVSAVPVPAAVWLMASGLLGMVGLSRRA